MGVPLFSGFVWYCAGTGRCSNASANPPHPPSSTPPLRLAGPFFSGLQMDTFEGITRTQFAEGFNLIKGLSVLATQVVFRMEPFVMFDAL